MANQSPKQKIIVVGAGPVGALAALYAAKKGDDVEIYELRGDLRDPATTPLNFTKSINLALSERGINGMRQSGSPELLDAVLADTIPMYGRMIHSRSKLGDIYEEPQAYDVHGRAIRAVDRAGLNSRLLDALATLPNVTFRFHHKLTGADFNRNLAWFEDHSPSPNERGGTPKEKALRYPEIEVKFDLMIGCDGAHSAARYHLMKFAQLDYKQSYIDTLWCEFHIQPKSSSGGSNSNKFAISPNHLHIWPGQTFMFIAIPSSDGSFTCTLFAPSSTFAELKASPKQNLISFFQEHFPGLTPELIAPDDIISQFSTNPHLPLISIKCSPYHYKSSVVIIGDAAHAMVPFYGQGMNAGLEDVRILFETLESHGVYSSSDVDVSARAKARGDALATYTEVRAPDAHAICDLALDNYYEMRSAVTSPVYLVRKKIEETISKLIPSTGVRTQYTRVSFENERYSMVQKEVRRQQKQLAEAFGGVLSLALLLPLTWWFWRGKQAQPALRNLIEWIARSLGKS
ncbi:kynurenine 3-monooxygenase, mitochondrial precursor [Agyrium rufum]|nr:kynurenine 3-monooxygenase, mitochondrial precursor [Agyrium rufum]